MGGSGGEPGRVVLGLVAVTSVVSDLPGGRWMTRKAAGPTTFAARVAVVRIGSGRTDEPRRCFADDTAPHRTVTRKYSKPALDPTAVRNAGPVTSGTQEGRNGGGRMSLTPRKAGSLLGAAALGATAMTGIGWAAGSAARARSKPAHPASKSPWWSCSTTSSPACRRTRPTGKPEKQRLRPCRLRS